MNTKVMEYIVAIAQEQSISRAAERFYLSQADLSAHLRNVEKVIGVPLFTRSSAGVKPTQAGIIFINDAQEILHMEKELNSALAKMRQQTRNQIHVMVDAPFYNRFIRMVIPQFSDRCPTFTLEVTNCNAMQARRALLDGSADLGVFYSSAPQVVDLECLSIGTTPVLTAFPKDFTGPADVHGLKKAVKDGMFVILYPVGTTMRAIEEQQLASHQIFPERILEGNNKSSIDHISAGGTCGVLIEPLLPPDIQQQVTLGEPLFEMYSMIAYSPQAALTATHQALMQIIMETFPVG